MQAVLTRSSEIGANGVLRDTFLKKGSLRRNVARTVGNVAGSFLYYSFAIAPLVSDMKKLAKSVLTIKNDLKKAKIMEGKVEKLHFKMKGSRVDPTYNLWQVNNSGRGVRFLRSESGSAIKTMVITGTRRPPFSSKGFSALNELMTRFASSGPASFVWERIPFSFVIDWFVDLRSITNSLDNALTGGTRVVLDASLSELKEATVSCVHDDHLLPYHCPALAGTEVAYRISRQYHRIPVAVPLGPVDSGRFGKRQKLLTGALAYQMVAKWLALGR